MAKHTPGPWCVAGNLRGWRTVQDSNSEIVTFCHQHPEEETMLANLRLIAAAPDLLEALKALLHYEKISEGFFLPRDTEAARAAIAKAEGR